MIDDVRDSEVLLHKTRANKRKLHHRRSIKYREVQPEHDLNQKKKKLSDV